MAYRGRGPVRRAWKAAVKRRYASRSKYRRSYAKKRTYRRAPITKKRILNMTSRKKRDTMQIWTNVQGATVSSTTFSNSPAVLLGSQTNLTGCYVFPWCATARDLVASDSSANTISRLAERTASACFMRGLAESVEIQVNNGTPWQWRRICFTAKGTLPGFTVSSTFAPYQETSAGITRAVNQLTGDRNSGAQYSLFDLLFKGQNSSDWTDVMIAKTDNSRLTIKYDKVMTIASGNEDGMIRTYKFWHPMNKTLVYDDDEKGDSMVSSNTSTIGKAGMGDYYVLDMFRSRYNGGASDQITFTPNATLYWHEK
ncbi:capsid protein [Chifec genomovirus UA13_113]|nr:capsid protein [Chifec genomovirus UA13_113]